VYSVAKISSLNTLEVSYDGLVVLAPAALEHPRQVLSASKVALPHKSVYDQEAFKLDDFALAYRRFCVLCRTLGECRGPGSGREPFTVSVSIAITLT
jgi:hypothetical protein